jgi:hypothetical protein
VGCFSANFLTQMVAEQHAGRQNQAPLHDHRVAVRLIPASSNSKIKPTQPANYFSGTTKVWEEQRRQQNWTTVSSEHSAPVTD